MFKLITISWCKNRAFFLFKKYLLVYFLQKSCFLQYLCPVFVIKQNWLRFETIITYTIYYNKLGILGSLGSKRESEESAVR